LRTLVRDGLVKRTVTPTVPPQVSYSHTPLGADLTVPLWGLISWVGNHTNDILEAQDCHDAATIHP
jgi:DNA-binding HxlR family transcriptional regulator